MLNRMIRKLCIVIINCYRCFATMLNKRVLKLMLWKLMKPTCFASMLNKRVLKLTYNQQMEIKSFASMLNKRVLKQRPTRVSCCFSFASMLNKRVLKRIRNEKSQCQRFASMLNKRVLKPRTEHYLLFSMVNHPAFLPWFPARRIEFYFHKGFANQALSFNILILSLKLWFVNSFCDFLRLLKKRVVIKKPLSFKIAVFEVGVNWYIVSFILFYFIFFSQEPIVSVSQLPTTSKVISSDDKKYFSKSNSIILSNKSACTSFRYFQK